MFNSLKWALQTCSDSLDEFIRYNFYVIIISCGKFVDFERAGSGVCRFYVLNKH